MTGGGGMMWTSKKETMQELLDYELWAPSHPGRQVYLFPLTKHMKRRC